MKAFISLIFISVFMLTGCSSNEIGRQYKFIEPSTNINSNIGFLKIYTYKYEEKGKFADDNSMEVFKGYTIYTPKGNLVKDVKKSYSQPKQVKLNEGNYIIIAELHKNIIQSFAVSIEKGRILEIDKSMIENPLAVIN